jgi:hypothetical protein
LVQLCDDALTSSRTQAGAERLDAGYARSTGWLAKNTSKPENSNDLTYWSQWPLKKEPSTGRSGDRPGAFCECSRLEVLQRRGRYQ